MTTEMLELARANAAEAGATNVEFLQGTIEDVPVPDAVVDVVISNCVINLSVDKAAVIAEMFRLLAPGGRIEISDVVAEDHLTAMQRAERGAYVGCIAGALSQQEYLGGQEPCCSADAVPPAVNRTPGHRSRDRGADRGAAAGLGGVQPGDRPARSNQWPTETLQLVRRVLDS